MHTGIRYVLRVRSMLLLYQVRHNAEQEDKRERETRHGEWEHGEIFYNVCGCTESRFVPKRSGDERAMRARATNKVYRHTKGEGKR